MPTMPPLVSTSSTRRLRASPKACPSSHGVSGQRTRRRVVRLAVMVRSGIGALADVKGRTSMPPPNRRKHITAAVNATKGGHLRDDDEAAIALESLIGREQVQGLGHGLGKQQAVER